MTRREFLLVCATSAPAFKVFGASMQSQFEGRKRFDAIVQRAFDEYWLRRPIGEIVARVGLELQDVPYVGWTLERDVEREFCFVTLEGLDCVTLFESSLGMARMLKRAESRGQKVGQLTPEMLVQEVAYTRYRGGKVGDYLSRLHYTCDWMFDNTEKGVVSAIGDGMSGAKPLGKTINFMSSNPNTYRQIKANPSLVGRLKEIEAVITDRENTFIPSAKVEANLKNFRSGDIIGLTTTLDGMDCAHTGLIVVQQGQPLFLHASSVAKKVVLDKPIDTIVASNAKYTGLMVVRPVWQ